MVTSFEAMAYQPSNIKQYFSDSTVFLTGGTGLLGKLILQKLLRSCDGINKIYILIREKKGKSVQKRYEELLESMIFDRLKELQPQFREKIGLIVGDCLLPNLNLKTEDRHKLIREVNCVLHCAATVRFDEKLRTATYINVRATRDLLRLCKQMKDLTSFVHVSTAYSNCIYQEIKETFYEPPVTGINLLQLVDTFDDDFLESITPGLIGDRPNTYAFTKAVAENVVKEEGKGLPIAIVRPSIVISTCKEPIPGWMDTVYGAVGATVGVGLGLVRTMHHKAYKIADLVPADYVINCAIAAAWDNGTKKLDNNKAVEERSDENNIEIYNYVSSVQNPITWNDFMKYTEKHGLHIPTALMIWYPFLISNSYYIFHVICVFFLHTVPAYIVDLMAYCLGKQPRLVKGYQKINKFLDVLAYFSTNQWKFHDDNTQELWKKLNDEDKYIFQFDIGKMNWDNYCFTYARGGRLYILKDPLDTVPYGKRKYFMLKVIHYTLVGFLSLGLYRLAMLCWKTLVGSI
ncbi:hypothetical protein ILUMI_24280 [Ignelater luminosus]|uniref:Fatty acyl-CoA reductase n=1 Tax=Ignelater luminosus TaxID=2038154 RepID=A0A8K0C9F3_IGNLU|nr:hypothetical protein ILUMI_24280 [Ignelater luminosus]